MTMAVAYCTNVHPTRSLDEAIALCAGPIREVRERLVALGATGPNEPLPLGWWLPNPVAQALAASAGQRARLRAALDAASLRISTVNAFPFGDFHAGRVKHAVYEPDWTSADRLGYTIALAEVVADLVEPGAALSISTLPIGWPTSGDERGRCDVAAERLVEALEALRGIRDRRGVHLRLDLEPEPGCLLQRGADLGRFARRHLLPAAARRGVGLATIAEFVGACLDVCHAAVMFEPPEVFVDAVREAGLQIGKVQVSSAPRIDFDAPPWRDDASLRERAMALLRAFAEERYLHQTMVRLDDGSLRFSDDLPDALAFVDGARGRPPRGEWRVHFHVPVMLETIGDERGDGVLATTQGTIDAALRATRSDDPVVEVETYAWQMLPAHLRGRGLTADLAQEIAWTRARLAAPESSR